MDKLSNQTQLLSLKESMINILLLGETGVGKSTFINAFANYLCSENIREALTKPPIVCAPTCISLLNDNNDTISIPVTPQGGKESASTGTHEVKEYIIPIKSEKRFVRFIDTPGMGSADGVEKDDNNMDDILNYLLDQPKLHAICFFLKPTTTRSNALFEYCLKQFLSRLEKSASQNLIFIFTNTRSTFYTAGETMSCLKKIIETIKSNPPFVEIPFNKENRFCMDNECFKYLAVSARNIKLNSSVIDPASKSWEVSSSECKRLLSYVEQLNPHHMSKTIDINKSKKLISQHFQILFDVSQMIDDTVRFMENFRYELETERKNIETLRMKLSAPQDVIEIMPLSHPVIICTSRKCTTRVKFNGKPKSIYEQICHDKPQFGQFGKKWFDTDQKVINRSISIKELKCKVCECHVRAHRIVDQLIAIGKESMRNNPENMKILNKEEVLQKRTQTLEKLKQDITEQSAECDQIVMSIAKFIAFLQNNSISPISDQFIQRIMHLIEHEETLENDGDWNKLIKLRKMLQKYEKFKANFSNQRVEVTVLNIEENLQQLYTLKHNGMKIKQLCEKQMGSLSSRNLNTQSQHTQSKSDKKETNYIKLNKEATSSKTLSATIVKENSTVKHQQPNLPDKSKLNLQKSTADFSQYVNMDEEMKHLFTSGHQPGLNYQQTPWPNLPFNHPMFAQGPYFGSPYSQFPPNYFANLPQGGFNFRPQQFQNMGPYNPNFSHMPNFYAGQQHAFEPQQPENKTDQTGNDLPGSWK